MIVVGQWQRGWWWGLEDMQPQTSPYHSLPTPSRQSCSCDRGRGGGGGGTGGVVGPVRLWACLLALLCGVPMECRQGVPTSATPKYTLPTIPLQDTGLLLTPSTKTYKSIFYVPSCIASHDWPTDLGDDKWLLVGFLLTKAGIRRERLGLKIPGAFTYAVKHVNEENLLPEGYKMRFEFHDTHGRESDSSRIILDLLVRDVFAIFGPEHTCFLEGAIAEGHNLPMLSYGCTDERASKFSTFARTIPSESYVVKAAVAAIRHNNWTRFSVIYEKDQESTKNTLVNEARRSNMTVNHVKIYDMDSLYLMLAETMNTTRIYVFVGHRFLVHNVLTAMAGVGMFPPPPARKEYVLLYIDHNDDTPNTWDYIFDHSPPSLSRKEECWKEDLTRYDGAFMVIANRKPGSSNFPDIVREYNKLPPFCFDRHIGDIIRHVPHLPAAHLFDSVQLYARVVSELYRERESPNITVEDVARDGAKIKDKLRNMTYTSILGFDMTMDSNASSEGKYSVYLFSDSPDKCNSKCPMCLHKISDYHSENFSLEATAISLKIRDVPLCGYDGGKCDFGQHYKEHIAWVMGSLLVLCLFISIIVYTNMKRSRVVGQQWRINQMHVTMSNHVPAGSRDDPTPEGLSYQRLEEVSVESLNISTLPEPHPHPSHSPSTPPPSPAPPFTPPPPPSPPFSSQLCATPHENT